MSIVCRRVGFVIHYVVPDGERKEGEPSRMSWAGLEGNEDAKRYLAGVDAQKTWQ